MFLVETKQPAIYAGCFVVKNTKKSQLSGDESVTF
jgi:hypothetical protein